MANIVYVRQTLVTHHDGASVTLREGEAWDADHPLVKARPELFAASPTRLNGQRVRVEDAVARPGVKRGGRGR